MDEVVGWLAKLTGTIARLDESILLAQPRYQDPRSLSRYRASVYSQNGEDGAIAEIFARIGTATKFFVEIGTGNGTQNNTRFLLEYGWSGIWWEESKDCCVAIRAGFAKEISDGRLKLVERLVTVENAFEVLRTICAPEFDLLSIDIDMNTSHVWEALHEFKPRVAVIEYNPNFPPSVSCAVPYDPEARWNGKNMFGASLKALEELGSDLGYRLVGCELSGINAYFVRDDLATDKLFLPPFTAEHHYEPPRLHFLTLTRGHPSAKRT